MQRLAGADTADYAQHSPAKSQYGSPAFQSSGQRAVLRDVNNEHDNSQLSVHQRTNSKIMTAPAASPLTANNRRRTAAQFVENMTGDTLPANSDREFRDALKTGVILCKLLQRVDPHAGLQVMYGNSLDAYRSNTITFLEWVNRHTAPPSAMFTLEELWSDGYEETPRIAECLCWLKATYGVESYERRISYGGASSAASTPRHGDMYNPQHSGSLSTQSSFSSRSNMPHGSPSAAMQSASHKGNQARIGVTKLMQQCTQLLKTRMSESNGKNDSIDSLKQEEMLQNFMGPVMEKLLGSLTQEYEKRLHKKENEVTAMEDKLERLKQQNEKLVTEVTAMRAELQERAAEAAHMADEASAEQLRELQQQHDDVLKELNEKQIQVIRLEEQLKSVHSIEHERFSALEARLHQDEARMQQLQDMEANYTALQEENRKLYNMVQDLKGSIRVFCRVRPMGRTGDSSSCCVDIGLDGELAIYDPVKGDRKQFRFDKIFDQGSTQQGVYEDVEPLVRSVLDGYNVCIFAYGQTGSGKTHTMSGTNVHQMDGRGINYRALDDLFALQEKRSGEVDYNIKVQMLEIYNENLRDLLVEPSANKPRNLDILNTQASGCNVPGAQQEHVSCSEDVLRFMDRGARNRAVGETRLNERSSRSHQILTVIVDGHNTLTGARSHGCLHLVDLAGSERVAKSEAAGERLLEAQHINKSLSALGDVMSALASKNGHVPFRNSKLTQLLQDSLSGQAKVMMFMHISPESNSFGETLSTLKFGTRVSEITLGQAKKNVESGKVFEAHEQLTQLQLQSQRQQAQVRALTSELAAAKAQGSSSQGIAKELEELRFLHTESKCHADAELSEARAKLDDALHKINELQAQLAMYKAQALQSRSRRTSALQTADSQGSQDFDQEASTLQPRLTLDLCRPTTPNSGLALRSPRTTADMSPCSTSTIDTTCTTPRGGPVRTYSSVNRHMERMCAARTRETTPTASPSSHAVSVLPTASSFTERSTSSSRATSSHLARTTSMPVSRPSTGGIASKAAVVKPPTSSRVTGGGMFKPSSRPDTATSRMPGTYSSTKGGVALERTGSATSSRRTSGSGWK